MPEEGHLQILPPKRSYTLIKQDGGMSKEDRHHNRGQDRCSLSAAWEMLMNREIPT